MPLIGLDVDLQSTTRFMSGIVGQRRLDRQAGIRQITRLPMAFGQLIEGLGIRSVPLAGQAERLDCLVVTLQ